MEPSKLDHSDIKPARPGDGRGCQLTQRGATATWGRHGSQVLALSRPAARLSMYRLRPDRSPRPCPALDGQVLSIYVGTACSTGRLPVRSRGGGRRPRARPAAAVLLSVLVSARGSDFTLAAHQNTPMTAPRHPESTPAAPRPDLTFLPRPSPQEDPNIELSALGKVGRGVLVPVIRRGLP